VGEGAAACAGADDHYNAVVAVFNFCHDVPDVLGLSESVEVGGPSRA